MFTGIWAAFWFALNNFFIEDKLALLHTSIVTLPGCKNGVGGETLPFPEPGPGQTCRLCLESSEVVTA